MNRTAAALCRSRPHASVEAVTEPAPLAVLPPAEAVTALALCKEGGCVAARSGAPWRLLSGGLDGRVRVWNITPSHQAPNTKHKTRSTKHQKPIARYRSLIIRYQAPSTRFQAPSNGNGGDGGGIGFYECLGRASHLPSS